MIRPLNIFDGLVLLFLYCKLTGSGPVPITWFEVFSPWMAEVIVRIIGSVIILMGGAERFKYWVWKIALKLRVRNASKEARRYIMKQAQEAMAESLKRGREAAEKTAQK
jgi:hypothetical protein